MRKRAQATRPRTMALSSAGLLLVLAATAGCSRAGGSKTPASGRPVTCTFIAKLDSIANTVAKADVHDPDTFDATMQTAVNDYVTNVRLLRAIAPSDLSSSLQRVEADVKQLRFDAAVADRAPLDAYAARTCGRVTSAESTTSAPKASTATTAHPSTTVPTGPPTTAKPSGG